MASRVFQNPFNYDIAVPAYNGSSIIVPPKKFVQGSYYQESVDSGILIEWVGTTPSSVDIVYIYPEQEGYFSGTPTSIERIIAGTGLAGGGTTGDVTLSIAPLGVGNTQLASNAVTSDKVSSGELVKSFNGLFDDINLQVGTNLSLSILGNIITLDAPTIGFSSVSSILPLVLVNNEGVLEGSIDITATNSGGAVALQTDVTPLFQTGYIALEGEILLNTDGFLGINISTNKLTELEASSYIILKNSDDLHNFIRLLSSTDEDLFWIDETGGVYAPTVTTNSLIAGTSAVSLDDTPVFSVDTTFEQDIILEGQLRATVGSEPSLLLTSASTTIPSIQLVGGPTSDLIEVRDLSDNLKLQIKGDGSLYSSSASFDSMSFNAQLVTTGAYDLSLVSGSMFACDCASGAITFQLPLIDPLVTKAGTVYTFTKTDLSSNNVLIAPVVGQTINGQASVLVTSSWTPLRVAAIIGTGPAPETFWMAV